MDLYAIRLHHLRKWVLDRRAILAWQLLLVLLAAAGELPAQLTAAAGPHAITLELRGEEAMCAPWTVVSGLEATRYSVREVPWLNSRRDEYTVCRYQQNIYFYSSAIKPAFGRGAFWSKPRLPLRLFSVVEGSSHLHSQFDRIPKTSARNVSDLGLTWDQQEGTLYNVQITGKRRQGQVTRLYHSSINAASKITAEMMDLLGDEFSNDFHPALSPDGTLLVFCSDRSRGLGGSDLYYTAWGEGHWSKPHNLGSRINSAGDELFPSFGNDGTLYFSSDGLAGYGQADLHETTFHGGSWKPAKNLGAVINTNADEYGMVWNDPKFGNTGYFCSNRKAGQGFDIYAFRKRPGLIGTVVDAHSRATIPDATVRIKEEGRDWVSFVTNSSGEVYCFFDADQPLELEVSAPDHAPTWTTVTPSSIARNEDFQFEIALKSDRSYVLSASIVDSLSGQPLDSVQVKIINRQDGAVLDHVALNKTRLVRAMEVGTDYMVMVQRPGYRSMYFQLPLSNFYGVELDQRTIRLAPKAEFMLVGTVTDGAGKPLAGNSQIDVLDLVTKKVIKTMHSDSTGAFGGWLDRSLQGRFSLFASHEGTETKHIYLYGLEDQYFPFALGSQVLRLDSPSVKLYYELGQTQVFGNQTEAIDDIYFYMMRNPDVHLELRTYTDAKGSSILNDEISHRRSAAIMTAITLRGGIDPARITRKDYGEQFLVNDCKDGVNCTEEQHLENRRTEVFFYKPEASNVTSGQK